MLGPILGAIVAGLCNWFHANFVNEWAEKKDEPSEEAPQNADPGQGATENDQLLQKES